MSKVIRGRVYLDVRHLEEVEVGQGLLGGVADGQVAEGLVREEDAASRHLLGPLEQVQGKAATCEGNPKTVQLALGSLITIKGWLRHVSSCFQPGGHNVPYLYRWLRGLAVGALELLAPRSRGGGRLLPLPTGDMLLLLLTFLVPVLILILIVRALTIHLTVLVTQSTE